jgi:hypothetical protein
MPAVHHIVTKEPKYRQVLAVAGLAAALVLLILGSMRVYSVWPDPALSTVPAPSGPPVFDPANPDQPVFFPPSKPAKTIDQLTGLEMVEHATFTGLKRHEGRLYLTYDPSQKKGKRSCPT